MATKHPLMFHQYPQILYDTREQTPCVGFIRPEYRPTSEKDKRATIAKEDEEDGRVTFKHGDYGLAHFSGIEPFSKRRVIWERKSHSDFRGSIGGDRERFFAEIERLRFFEFRAVMVSCTREEIYQMPEAQRRRMKPGQRTLTASQIDGAIRTLQVNANIHVFFLGSEENVANEIMAQADIFWSREIKYARHLMPKRGEEARR